MRPSVWAASVLVPDGVVMDVVEMMAQLSEVADRVLPESSLPDTASALSQSGSRAILLGTSCREIVASEIGFNVGHPQREIGIAVGKGDNKVEMVGKENDGVKNEVVPQAASLQRVVKDCPGGLVGEDRSPALGNQGEKEGPARPEFPNVVRHGNGCNQEGRD